MVATLGWYLIYARGHTLPTPQPPHIVPVLRTPHILVPIKLPDPFPLPQPLLDAFRDLKLFVLGYQVVPEQAREEAGEEASQALEKLVDQLDEQGTSTNSQLVFTPNVAQTLERYVHDEQCHAVLMPQGKLSACSSPFIWRIK